MMVVLLVWAALLLLAVRTAGANGWCPLSERACGVPGLPSAVVEGIIHVESSGRPLALGLGVGSRHLSVFPASPFQARVFLRVLLSREARANVGIGLMQVNWLWWGDELERSGVQAFDLLDPEVNLRAGCRVLRQALLETTGSFEARLGRYHSWQVERGRRYAEQVLAEAWRLEREAGRERRFALQMNSLRRRLQAGISAPPRLAAYQK